MSHPNCLKEAAILPCPLKFIMPVHYALTNEEAPPPWYGFSNVRESGLLELENHKYTLKTIKQGLVFVEWDAVKGDPVVYKCTNGVYRELTKHGYPSGKHLITIPDDPSITKIRMLYIRTVDTDEDKHYEIDEIEPAWKGIKAHLQGKDELYQTITLWEKPYSGALSEIAPLVEEFREGQGELHYLPSWAECASILHADQRRNEVIVPAGPHGSSKLVPPASYPQYAPWEASIDPGREEQESPPARKNCVAALLHDSLGQVLDCQRVYSLSLKGIENFCRIHTPLHASAFLAEDILASCAKGAKEQNQKKAAELAARHELGALKPEGNAIAPPDRPRMDTNPSAIEENYAREREWKRQEKDWRESYGSRCWAWEEKEKYLNDPAYKNEEYQAALRETLNFSQDIKIFREAFNKEHCILAERAVSLVRSWYALLTNTQPFSFQKIFTECLKVEGKYDDSNKTALPSGLLLLRDTLLHLGHLNIAHFPALPGDPLDESSPEYEKLKDDFDRTLDTELFSKGDGPHSTFLCDIMNTGRVPTDETTALFNELWPYCLRPHGKRYAEAFTKVPPTRLGLSNEYYAEKPVSAVLTLSSLLNTAGDFVDPSVMIAVKTNGIDFVKNGLLAILDKQLQDKAVEIQNLIDEIKILKAHEKRYLEAMAEMRQAMAEAHTILTRIFKSLGIKVSDSALLRMLKLKSGVWGTNFAEHTWVDAFNRYQVKGEKLDEARSKKIQVESNKESLNFVRKAVYGLATAGLAAACAYNIFMAVKALMNAPQGHKEQIAPGNVLNIASSACSLVDWFWSEQSTNLAKRTLGKVGFALDILCSYYDTMSLLSARNPGAAAGTAMMGAASAAFWILAGKGVALASLPFLGVAALLALGYCVYSTFLDSKALSFLKTCLWNRVYQGQRNMLQGAFVPCLTDIVLPVWEDWNDHVATALRDRFPPIVNCDIADGLLSVHVSACGVCPKVGLAIHLNYFGDTSYSRLNGCYGRNAEISEKYLKEKPKDIFIGNVYNFDAIYNVKQFISDFSNPTYMDVYPHAVTITVKYSYAADIKAEDMERSVALSPEKALAAPVQSNSAYPYMRTNFD